jgi:hypothetical protein
MKTDKVTCQKCFGTGYLSAFAHVSNGDCFNCGTTGKVEATELIKPNRGTYTAPVSKKISIDIGTVEITKCGIGFKADLLETVNGRIGSGGCVWFDVQNSKVVGLELSNGLMRITTINSIQRQLQSALRN